MKLLFKHFSFYTLILVSLLASCKKDDPTDSSDPDANSTTIEKLTGTPGEAITLYFPKSTANRTYVGTLGSKDVSLTKTGKNLAFIIPNLERGNHLLSCNVDGNLLKYDIQVQEKTTVQNLDTYISSLQENSIKEGVDYEEFLEQLASDGYLDTLELFNEISYWRSMRQKAESAIIGMSQEQKQELANILEANKEWVSELEEVMIEDYFAVNKRGVDKGTCEKLIKEGRNQLEEGKTFTALGTSIKAYWCSLKYYADKKSGEALSKAAVLIENSHPIPQVTLINLIGQKIDKFSKEIDQLGRSTSIAEELEDAERRKRESEIVFSNGTPGVLVVKIKFRSLKADDVNGPQAFFADFYKDYIAAFSDYVKSFNEPLVWRPGYSNETRTVDFNQFLSINKASISKNNVLLLNTQYNDDKWEVAFATDEDEEQLFDFDIQYDDGEIQISKTFKGKVNAEVQEEKFSYVGTWVLRFIQEDGTLYQSDRITFDSTGESTSVEYYMHTNIPDKGWQTSTNTWSISYKQNGNLSLTNNFYNFSYYFPVVSVDDKVFFGNSSNWKLELHRN